MPVGGGEGGEWTSILITGLSHDEDTLVLFHKVDCAYVPDRLAGRIPEADSDLPFAAGILINQRLHTGMHQMLCLMPAGALAPESAENIDVGCQSQG
jgi:hypothetical protein